MKKLFLISLLAVACKSGMAQDSAKKWNPGTMIKIVKGGSKWVTFTTSKFVIYADNVFLLSEDTCGVWSIPKGVDSAQVIAGMLKCMEMQSKVSADLRDDLRKQGEGINQTATKYYNVTRWIVQDYGISYDDLIGILKKHSRTPANLNNKHKLKRKT